VFWAVSGGHILATLFSGGLGRGLVNTLALGVSAWLSRLLIQPQKAPLTFSDRSFPSS